MRQEETGISERGEPDPGQAAPPVRALFMTSIPSPYQVDLFTLLAKQPGVDIHVFFCGDTRSDRSFDVPEQYPFPATVLPSHVVKGMPHDWHKVQGLKQQLLRTLPIDIAVLGGYAIPAIRQLHSLLRQEGIPWYLWGEGHEKKQRSALLSHVKTWYLQRFLRSCAGIWGIGRLACRDYAKLVPLGTEVLNIPYSPNLSHLLHPSKSVSKQAESLRGDWDIPDPIVLLFSGRLSPRKAPDLLVDAFLALAPRFPRLRLQFAGDGPLESGLRAKISAAGLMQRVRWLGFVQQESLSAAYLSSNLFVLPTRGHEGWGVVVQEAMAARLPVLVSDRVGAGADLIRNSRVGAIFAANDLPALTTTIERFVSQPEQLSDMGKDARETVAMFDCSVNAELIADVLRRHSPKLNSKSHSPSAGASRDVNTKTNQNQQAMRKNTP